ncbi:HpcH/HpaI aldolase/citrate lyase family protein [Brachybacterium paraconglomeratum]
MGKALAYEADGVVVDLEDAVTAGVKDRARSQVAELLGTDAEGTRDREHSDRAKNEPVMSVQVRINHLSTPWFEADAEMLAGLPQGVGARCPKVESPEQIRQLAAALPGRALHILIESAMGVENAFHLAASSPQMATIGLGEADLSSDLRITGEVGLVWARGRSVNAARAAGLPAPMMSVYRHVRDLTGLRTSCRRGHAMGFVGRAAIHPRQLATITQAFSARTRRGPACPGRRRSARAEHVHRCWSLRPRRRELHRPSHGRLRAQRSGDG